jgi:hypothetical protein
VRRAGGCRRQRGSSRGEEITSCEIHESPLELHERLGLDWEVDRSNPLDRGEVGFEGDEIALDTIVGQLQSDGAGELLDQLLEFDIGRLKHPATISMEKQP